MLGNLYFTEKQGADEFSQEDERLAQSFARLAVTALESEVAHRGRDFFKKALDDDSDAVIIADPNGNILLWNPAAERVYGYSKKEALGQPFDLIVPKAMRKEKACVIEEMLREGTCAPFQTQHLQKDGTTVPVSATLSLLNGNDGKAIAFFWKCKDLTTQRKAEDALRASERRYSEMLENVHLITVSLDLEGNIVFCNEFLLRLTGWRREEILGRSWFDLFLPSEVRERVKEMFFDTMMRGAIAPHYENEIVTRQGLKRLISWNNTVLRNPQEELVGTTSIGEDITERRQAEEHLLRSRKLEGLGQLAAGVAHDFNNTLGIVSGSAELLETILKEKPTAPEARELLEIIQNAVDSGSATIKRLQDFARHRLDPPVGWADINAIVQDVVNMTRPRWKNEMAARGYSVIMKVDASSTHSFARGDEGELCELLVNLIHNALDAMPEGGQIKIATQDAGDFIKVTVSDTGVGMAAEIQEKAFDPFFTTKGDQGSGLGLSMVFGIINRYGGRIDIESEPGAGTSVIMTLPIAEEEAEMEGNHTKLPTRPARILLVEDEPDMARVIQSLLEEDGYSVEVATDGAAATTAFSKSPHDLVITDLAMPGMSGIELARQVKAVSPETPVILLTGWQAVMEPDEMSEAGIARVLVKPVKKVDLHRNVAEMLNDSKRA
jgi:PAS domain S-box-containing protein